MKRSELTIRQRRGINRDLSELNMSDEEIRHGVYKEPGTDSFKATDLERKASASKSPSVA